MIYEDIAVAAEFKHSNSFCDTLALHISKLDLALVTIYRPPGCPEFKLYNSEAWHATIKDDTEILNRVDESLLSGLVSAHSKTPKEALFLEIGTIPIKYIWASRRLTYLQNILKRDKTELVRRVYQAQKENSLKGDFAQLVQEDAKLVNLNMSDDELEKMGGYEYKKLVKVQLGRQLFCIC